MSFLHIPFLPSNTKSRKLRSLHLIAGPGPTLELAKEDNTQAAVRSTTSNKPVRKQKHLSRHISRIIPVGGIIPIPPIFYFGLAILCSIIFVLTIPSVFHGVTAQDSVFKPILDDVSQVNPGIVLLGENVDIDVDEPSITIRWSIVACGQDYVLPGSSGIHGSSLCGLPKFPLQFYVDGDTQPTGSYDPGLIPYNTSGQRRKIQNLVQFDSDHTLDVHNDRLYPFDTYFLSSTVRVSSLNQSIPISKLATLDLTSSFVVETVDIESYETDQNGTDTPSRDIDMEIRRPLEARVIALSLFGLSWFLTHICIGNVVLARRTIDTRPILKLLIVSGATVIGLPQLRNSMPDAPGLDGVLIDAIGFFPQMIIAGLSVVILLLIIIAGELDRAEGLGPPRYSSIGSRSFLQRQSRTKQYSPLAPLPISASTEISVSKQRPPPPPPPPPSPASTSADISRYNRHRMVKHLKGEFVFPPVNVEILPSVPEEPLKSPAHRRFKTIQTGPLLG
jgi:hypothetical protein